jgi:chemotaxis methyl-accepting protein methylase
MMIEEVVPVEIVRRFRHLAARQLGLDIGKTVEPMIGARISKRLGELQVSLQSFMSRIGQDTDEEIVAFWDFVRPRPVRFFARWADCRRLNTYIRRALDEGCLRFRFWSAGCGSGEEAYTLVLVAHHAFEAAGLDPFAVDLKVLVTDLSPRTLEMGKRGLYAAPQIWDVPKQMQKRHFVETNAGFQISDEIYSRVVFRQLNLSAPPFPMTGKLDAVFCQEAVQSMVPHAQRRAIKAARALLANGGFMRTGLADEFLQRDDEPGKGVTENPSRGMPRSPTAC